MQKRKVKTCEWAFLWVLQVENGRRQRNSHEKKEWETTITKVAGKKLKLKQDPIDEVIMCESTVVETNDDDIDDANDIF